MYEITKSKNMCINRVVCGELCSIKNKQKRNRNGYRSSSCARWVLNNNNRQSRWRPAKMRCSFFFGLPPPTRRAMWMRAIFRIQVGRFDGQFFMFFCFC